MRNFSNTKQRGEAPRSAPAASRDGATRPPFSRSPRGASAAAQNAAAQTPQIRAAAQGICAGASPRLAALCASLTVAFYREAPRLMLWMRALGW